MTNAANETEKQKNWSEKAVTTATELDQKVNDIFNKVRSARIWAALVSPDSTDEFIRAIMREVYLSICWYQRYTTEAGFHMLGRLPKHEIPLLKSLMLHKVEEAEHGEWAVRDFVYLGGNESIARNTAPSPSTFAVASIWWRIAMFENPLGYLGAEYLFESLTVKVCEPLLQVFKKRGFQAKGLQFFIEHATEDIKHTNLIRHFVCDVVTRYPESAESMIRCFDYFSYAYPLSVWNEAMDRAICDRK